jgi:hypothetical protein
MDRGAFDGATLADLSALGFISDAPDRRALASPGAIRLANLVALGMAVGSIRRAKAFQAAALPWGALDLTRFEAEAEGDREFLSVASDATDDQVVEAALAKAVAYGLTPREMAMARRFLEPNAYTPFPAEPLTDDVAGESTAIPV